MMAVVKKLLQEQAKRRCVMNRQKGKESRAIAVNALAAALVCIGTMAIQIPIPLGYMHLGNACILLMAAMFGPVTGMLAGGIGSAMADLLTGYTQWVLPTLLIKCAMGFAAGSLARENGHSLQMASPRTFLASISGTAVMVFGYTAAGAVMNGSIYTGLLQVPGLTVEGILGIAVFYAAGIALRRAHVLRILPHGNTDRKGMI